MSQNELFNPDEMLQITDRDLVETRERFKVTGRQQGDSISDQAMSRATHIIRVKMRSMNIDLDTVAREAGMSIEDYIEETDIFYEIVNDFMNAYLQGLEETSPFPFLGD